MSTSCWTDSALHISGKPGTSRNDRHKFRSREDRDKHVTTSEDFLVTPTLSKACSRGSHAGRRSLQWPTSGSAVLPWNWRRGELNPCPDRSLRELLHVYPMRIFKGPDVASAHRRPPSVHEILHRPTRSLRRTISLLSMSPAVAGVQPVTSRSIKPRERDLGDLRLFVLVRILTRPTNHPRHAACASNHQSKPVRPRFFGRQ